MAQWLFYEPIQRTRRTITIHDLQGKGEQIIEAKSGQNGKESKVEVTLWRDREIIETAVRQDKLRVGRVLRIGEENMMVSTAVRQKTMVGVAVRQAKTWWLVVKKGEEVAARRWKEGSNQTTNMLICTDPSTLGVTPLTYTGDRLLTLNLGLLKIPATYFVARRALWNTLLIIVTFPSSAIFTDAALK